MPKVDLEANARKRTYDALAADLLSLNKSKLEQEAAGIAFDLLGPDQVRLCITGGAGSGKTSVAAIIGERLNLPVFDFDEYVPGGFHEDADAFRKRLLDGMTNLWNDLPVKGGWIIEHVEACNENMLKAFHPTHCLLVHPKAHQLRTVAEARAAVAGGDPKSRVRRAMESSEYAIMQFEEVPGEIVKRGPGWTLKQMKR